MTFGAHIGGAGAGQAQAASTRVLPPCPRPACALRSCGSTAHFTVGTCRVYCGNAPAPRQHPGSSGSDLHFSNTACVHSAWLWCVLVLRSTTAVDSIRPAPALAILAGDWSSYALRPRPNSSCIACLHPSPACRRAEPSQSGLCISPAWPRSPPSAASGAGTLALMQHVLPACQPRRRPKFIRPALLLLSLLSRVSRPITAPRSSPPRPPARSSIRGSTSHRCTRPPVARRHDGPMCGGYHDSAQRQRAHRCRVESVSPRWPGTRDLGPGRRWALGAGLLIAVTRGRITSRPSGPAASVPFGYVGISFVSACITSCGNSRRPGDRQRER